MILKQDYTDEFSSNTEMEFLQNMRNDSEHDMNKTLEKLHLKYCGFIPLCSADNAHQEPEVTSNFQTPCCVRCSCLPDCVQKENCCPDFIKARNIDFIPTWSNDSISVVSNKSENKTDKDVLLLKPNDNTNNMNATSVEKPTRNEIDDIEIVCVRPQVSQQSSYEPPHDKTNKMTVRPAKTQISLGIRPD